MTAHLRDFNPGFAMIDMRNGVVGDITACVPSTAIDRKYFWPVIADMPDGRHIPMAEMYMRAQTVLLQTNDAAITAPVARDQAIVLGAMRAAYHEIWKVRTIDLSADEIVVGALTYIPAVAATPAAGNVAAVAAVAEGVATAFAGGTAAAAGAAWTGWTAMTAAESLVAQRLTMLAIPALVAQGWSITRSGHHFLSEAGKSARSMYDGILRQWNSDNPESVTQWLTARSTWFEDVAFHKAGHPVRMALKASWAQSIDVKARITRAGFGAAALRLPAIKPEFEYPKMICALLKETSQTIAEAGGSVNYDSLQALVTTGVTSTEDATRIPAIDQAIALAHTLDPLLAIAAGVLWSTSENGTRSSICKAYSFKNLMAQNPTNFNLGEDIARAISRRRRDDMLAGNPVVVNIVFAA